MIEGFKLRVTSSELRSHCEGRSLHHTDRAKTKEAELPNLQAAMTAIRTHADATNVSQKTKPSMSNSYHMEDPVGDLEKDIADHRNKALVFSFFAAHLFDEDYTLTEPDLQRLEILKR